MKWRRRAIVACLALVTFSVWGFGIQSGLLWGLLRRGGAIAQPSGIVEVKSPGEDVQSPSPKTSIARPSPTSVSPLIVTVTRGPTATATRRVAATSTPTPSSQATHTGSRDADIPSGLPLNTTLTLTPPPEGRYLVVDQDRQVMTVYENGRIIRIIPVSTGAPYENSFTPAWRGVVGPFWGKARFRNSDLWADYIWYLFPGATGSILIHSVPYVPNGDEKIYDRPEALGVEPASKGCVRIAPEDAQWLAAWNPVGVPIEITPYHGVIKPANMAP